MSAAIASRTHWCYLVLTYPAGDWPDPAKLFRFGVLHWSKLRKRLTRRFGKIHYIQTWEVTKRQVPHCNLVVSNENLYNSTISSYKQTKEGWLEPTLQEVGFGKICWLGTLYDNDGMAGYLTKLASELTGASVKNQVPINAPPHFRRLRASRGLLPKRAKDDTITGQLFRMPADMLNEQLGRS